MTFRIGFREPTFNPPVLSLIRLGIKHSFPNVMVTRGRVRC